MINNMIAFLGTLSPGSVAYEEMKASILELIYYYQQLGLEISWAMGQIIGAKKQKANLGEAEAWDFPTTGLAQVGLTLTGAMKKQDEVTKAINRTNRALQKEIEKIAGIKFEWEKTFNTFFKQYDDFESSMLEASAIVEKLMYFEIDLDTTKADEKLKEMIQNMVDFMSQISPTSQAYADYREQIMELIMLYQQLGKTVPQSWKNIVGFQHGGMVPANMAANLHAGEAVLPSDAVNKLGAANVSSFIQTKDVGELFGSGQNVNVHVHVHNHEMTPQGWTQVTKDHIEPNIREIQGRDVRSRNFER